MKSTASKRAQQDAYAEGFRAGLARSQQAARLAESAQRRSAGGASEREVSEIPSLTIWSHEPRQEPMALAVGVDPTRLTAYDLILRAAALAGEALAWAVADECARNTALTLPEADVGSCAAHALANIGAYERACARRVPPTSVPHAELRDALAWLSTVHAEFSRPSFARFYGVADDELDAALARAGALVRAFSAAGSGLRKNLQAVQLHARHARRDAIARAAARPWPGALGPVDRASGVSGDMGQLPEPQSVAELEARVEALLDHAADQESEPLLPPPTDTQPQPPDPLPLLEQAARARSLASQRDALVAAELAAAAACDYSRAASLKAQADEAAYDAEDARVSAEARARRARERVWATARLLGHAHSLELRAALARDYAGGAARVAKSRAMLEEELGRAREDADFSAQLPARLAPVQLVRALPHSIDVRWAADGADSGASLGQSGLLRFETTVAYVLQWARDDTLELRRPRSPAAQPAQTGGSAAQASPARLVSGHDPRAPTLAATAHQMPAAGGAQPPAKPSDEHIAELWEALAALAPELRSPAVRSVCARSPLLLAGRTPDEGGDGGVPASAAEAATASLALFWRGPTPGFPPGAKQPSGGARRRGEHSAHSRSVQAPLDLIHLLAALNATVQDRQVDDATFREEAGGGELRASTEQLPLEVKREKQPVPNAAVATPVGAPVATSGKACAPPAAMATDYKDAGASAAGAGTLGAEAGSPSSEPPLEELDMFRLGRAAPLEPGVAYRLRVLAVSAASLEGTPSVELRCMTPIS